MQFANRDRRQATFVQVGKQNEMLQVVLSIVTLALSASVAFAQGGTAFTYQGRLQDAGAPANGTFSARRNGFPCYQSRRWKADVVFSMMMVTKRDNREVPRQ